MSQRSAQVNARLDRLPTWGLNPLVYVVLGACYLLAFYDIAVIGVALPRLSEDLQLAGSEQALPITANLIGYIVGAYFLGNVADAIGRRRALSVVVTVLTVASVLSALSWDATSLTVFRFFVGIGIGSQITLAATMIGEFAPAQRRGRYMARNILWAAMGTVVAAVVAVPLLDLPGSVGWRVLFGLGGIIVVALTLFNDRVLPESPRWLAAHGDIARAEQIVASMEERSTRRTGAPLPAVTEATGEQQTTKFPTGALFRRPLRTRLVTIFAFWFMLYFCVYSFLAYETTLVDELGVPLPNPVLLTAIGFLGGVVGAVVQPLFIDRIERKHGVMSGLVVSALGLALMALASGPVLVTAGIFLMQMGTFLAIIPAYAYTAEIFPTRARASAMGVGDGLGHAGGAVSPLVVVPLLASLGPRPVFWFLALGFVVAVLIMLAALRTSGRPLTELAQ